MADYIPSNEAAKLLWLWNLAMWLWRDNALNGLLYGFSFHEVNIFRFAVVQAKHAAASAAEKEVAYRAGVVAKREAVGAAIARSRDFVRRLQAQPAMTDAVRAEAGITVPDATKTAESPRTVEEITPPDVVLDWSKRQRVTLHFGLNPHDENHNAKPAGVHAAQIQYHRGGLPTLEADWVTLDIDTESPYIHILHEDTPTTYAYRACWVDTKLKRGPYGDPVVCTVSV